VKGDLIQKQSLPLEAKIQMTKNRIKQWLEHWDYDCYVSFSGGKDSTVLLHIARQIDPEIKAVFCNTGLEYPEIKDFVKTWDNVDWIKPRKTFRKVIDEYGWPIISKEQSQYIDQWRKAKSKKTKDTRWNGNSYGRGKISEKWKFIVDAPFKISDQCCNWMKKDPFKIYEKKTGLRPIIGTLAEESSKRVQDYNLSGCNAFDNKRPISKPLSVWLDKDILAYKEKFGVEFSKIYSMGRTRTGCMFCLYGHHLDGGKRLDMMKETHPKQYNFCMDTLGMKEVLKWYPERESRFEQLNFFDEEE
jgi:3'-phosphoadenosine 5'-phosphosulfate sulfotransferase (PAPS reductase)/FAD synthetase